MFEIIPDRKAYRRLQHLLPAHRTMLADPVRNRAFFEALRRSVTSRSRVLDVGAGTGIWAIAAARLGARRVVAIEKERLLIPLIRRLAEE
ncbi:MAG: 50S ribosomal protein L11 methyltransferase [Planctomycetes bacterium]|nr:50S ribosomal protein L11 methyltransferase [Planctomycetota bacterium]